MIKKILLLFVSIVLIGCHAAKPIIVTKKAAVKQKTEGVQAVGKPHVVAGSKAKNSNAKTVKTEPRKTETEVIVSTSKTVVTTDVIVRYVAKFKNIAMGNMKNYGIPASIILAQGILESGAGNGDLALSANNHFGIKCHIGWTGESVKHDDDVSQECFRKYDNPAESFKDHALFLTSRNRYSKLFDLPKGDYKAWAHGLRAAGYATDPKYPDKLISYIERYSLHQYDNQALDANFIANQEQLVAALTPETNFQSDSGYVVQKGDTLYSISKKFALKVEDLKQINNLLDNTLSVGQRLILK